jgi:hypothetical protein
MLRFEADAFLLNLLTGFDKARGKIETFLDWGITSSDYKCLHVGMMHTERTDLLPPQPKWEERPSCWWRLLKQRLGLHKKLDLSLGPLFINMFPHEQRLYSHAHQADADVKMTIHLINTYLQRVLGSDPLERITKYFQRVESAEDI